MSITNVKTTKEFNITSILPIDPYSNDFDLKHDIETIQNESAYVDPIILTEAQVNQTRDIRQKKSNKRLT